VTFDVFGDFETRGYLRNTSGLKDLKLLKVIEHRWFQEKVPGAMAYLERQPTLQYQDVLATHKQLFGEVYPWAGQDRAQTAPDKSIGKAGRFDLFSHPSDCARSCEYALAKGQDIRFMRARPGEVMGVLAYAHPFLDGNGRTIMCVHADLARRANIHIDWPATDKTAYLEALTRELDNPGKGVLDGYLKAFTKAGPAPEPIALQLSQLPGLASSEPAKPERPPPGIGGARRRFR
jgi:cell filamentation protein